MRRLRRAPGVLVALLRRWHRRAGRAAGRARDRRGDRIALLAARRAARPRRLACQRVLRAAEGGVPAHWRRSVLSGALPIDPLAGGSGPAVDVLIPCHGRDLALLPLVLAGARLGVGPALGRITVVVPDADVDAATVAVDDPASDVEVRGESAVLPAGLIAAVRSAVPARRHGWVLQQLVKLHGAAGPDRDATLLLDADTVLLTRRTWVDAQGRQLLTPVHEWHPPYARHHARFWSDRTPRLGLSFVAHHQLVRRDVLAAMFGTPTAAGLAAWLHAADWAVDCPVSEYHDYGTWLSTRDPDRAVMAAFRNVRSPRADVPDDVLLGGDVGPLIERFPGALSVSLHAYLG